MFDQILSIVLGVLVAILAVVFSIRVILEKRDERVAIAWVGLIVFAPIVGSLLYVLFGINRVQRRSRMIRNRSGSGRHSWHGSAAHDAFEADHDIAFVGAQARLTEVLGQPPFTRGNRIEALVNGEAAYPAMLRAIDEAETSVALSTYIFNDDRTGRQFADALARAVQRDVSVRVLIDGIGSLYSRPPIVSRLRARRVQTERFLFSVVPWRMSLLNMRNHQKILVTDGRIGFTGGMNIKDGHRVETAGARATQDVHFRLEGPVVQQLMAAFAHEWRFTANEELAGEAWFPPAAEAGPAIARAVTAGPDGELESIGWILLSALGQAREQVRIVTPYFLPDEALVVQLCLAAARGVSVDIVMPERNNLPFIKWASMSHLDEMMEAGCRFWLSPPPFDHSKLMVVDGVWSFFGSTNWDPRSLRLNFELNVECCDHAVAAALGTLIDGKLSGARPLTIGEIQGRSMPTKLRDGVMRLFRPYL